MCDTVKKGGEIVYKHDGYFRTKALPARFNWPVYSVTRIWTLPKLWGAQCQGLYSVEVCVSVQLNMCYMIESFSDFIASPTEDVRTISITITC